MREKENTEAVRVVRVDDIGSLYVKDDKVWMAFDEPPGDYIVGDVIELTNQSKAIFGDGYGDRYRTRLVSEWEDVNA